MKKMLATFLLVLSAVGLSAMAGAQPAAAPAVAAPPSPLAKTLSIEDIWKSPRLDGLTLSRSGKYLAATAPSRGRMNLLVIDMETQKGQSLTSFDDFDVINVSWVGDDRLMFSLGQFNSPTGPGEFDGGGLFVVNRDGTNFRRLAATVRESRNRGEFVRRGLGLFRTLPERTDEVIAMGNLTASDSLDLYRLNLNTGRTTPLTLGRPSSRSGAWLLDSKMVPRVMMAGVKDELTQVVFYRKNADSPWAEIARYSPDKGAVFVPLAFESDDQTLQVATNKDRDTMAVYRYNPNEKKLGELIASHPRYDMGADSQGQSIPGVLVTQKDDKIVGYQVDADKRETVWIDEARAKTQRTIDATLPDTINSFQRTPDSNRVLITAYSDVKSRRWYVFDEQKRAMEEIGAARPWLDGKLVQQRPMRYTTRDGLEIPGYLFLPADYKPGMRLPTIVHIHGGPFARADFSAVVVATSKGNYSRRAVTLWWCPIFASRQAWATRFTRLVLARSAARCQRITRTR